jgi:hypothetical protein
MSICSTLVRVAAGCIIGHRRAPRFRVKMTYGRVQVDANTQAQGCLLLALHGQSNRARVCPLLE